mmetsp:Transcript_9756/g.19538  ORF Transcript_9756/g.19538 Transcript_9756/m.19538 type:complete len:284 (-) Transcript_9756:569-1420(-)
MITKFTYEDRRVTDARLLSLALFELRHCPLHQLSQPPATLFDGLAHFLRFLRGLLFSLLAQRSCWGFNLHVVSLAAFQTAHLLRPRKLPHRFCLAGLQVDGKLPLLLLWKFAHLLLGVYPQAFLQLLAVILGVKAAQDVHDRLVRIHEDPVELRVVVKTDRVHRPLGPGGEERHLHGQRVRHHREALSEGLVLLLISKVVPRRPPIGRSTNRRKGTPGGRPTSPLWKRTTPSGPRPRPPAPTISAGAWEDTGQRWTWRYPLGAWTSRRASVSGPRPPSAERLP